jgi:hypothetical protein
VRADAERKTWMLLKHIRSVEDTPIASTSLPSTLSISKQEKFNPGRAASRLISQDRTLMRNLAVCIVTNYNQEKNSQEC